MIMIGDQACKNFVWKAALTLSSGRFVYSCWWTPERESNHCPNFKGDFKFLFSWTNWIVKITLPHFSPGQGKCPGWWTSTWWAFIFPENFVLKIGSFDNFSIYQMITFPRIKVHKSSKTFFNDYRCCQNKNKNGNRQQWNLWDDGDPWYGFSSRFSINHQIEEHGNHQQSHSDPWFGFSLRFSINHHEEEYQQSHSHSHPWYRSSSRFSTFCKESLSALRTWDSLAIRRHLGNHLIFIYHLIFSIWYSEWPV